MSDFIHHSQLLFQGEWIKTTLLAWFPRPLFFFLYLLEQIRCFLVLSKKWDFLIIRNQISNLGNSWQAWNQFFMERLLLYSFDNYNNTITIRGKAWKRQRWRIKSQQEEHTQVVHRTWSKTAEKINIQLINIIIAFGESREKCCCSILWHSFTEKSLFMRSSRN